MPKPFAFVLIVLLFMVSGAFAQDETPTLETPPGFEEALVIETGLSTLGALAWSPDGTELASGFGWFSAGSDEPKDLNIYDPVSGDLLRSCEGGFSSYRGIAWSPDGTQFITVGGGLGNFAAVLLWDAASCELIREIPNEAGIEVEDVVWSETHGVVLTNSPVQILNAELTEPEVFITDTAWSIAVGEQYLAYGGGRRPEVVLMDLTTDPPTELWRGTDEFTEGYRWPQIGAIALNPDETQVASARGNVNNAGREVQANFSLRAAPVLIWDIASGDVVQTLEGHNRTVMDIVWLADGTQVMSGGADGIRWWDVASGELLYASESIFVVDFALSPDGTRLAVVNAAGTIRIWELE